MSEAAQLLDVLLKARAMRTEDYLLIKAELDSYKTLQRAIRLAKVSKYDGDRTITFEYPEHPEWKLQP